VPVLKEYQKFLEEDLLPRAKGEWRIGKDKFAKKLDMELDAGLSAAEVLAEAEREAERVERDMYTIARHVWAQTAGKRDGKNGTAPLPPDDAEGRRSTIRQVLGYYAKDHGKPEEIAKDARATVAQIKEFIAKNDILRLPDPDRCTVIEMPE